MLNWTLIPTFSFLFLVLLVSSAEAQNPTRFQKSIDRYNEVSVYEIPEAPILFVGSSSILMWKSLADDYPNHPVLNRGFGGSVMSDLFYYCEDLIIRYKPKQIFIYEGDNDISMSKSTQAVMDTTQLLIEKIRLALPDAAIVLLSAKPSLQRWHLRDQYKDLNAAFSEYAEKQEGVTYADIWHPMLHENGLIRSDIFIKDGLHMNALGYDIWQNALRPYLAE